MDCFGLEAKEPSAPARFALTVRGLLEKKSHLVSGLRFGQITVPYTQFKILLLLKEKQRKRCFQEISTFPDTCKETRNLTQEGFKIRN